MIKLKQLWQMRWKTVLMSPSSPVSNCSGGGSILQSVSEITLHEEIIRLWISFRQNYPIKLPDAIIAATAQYAKVPLMTRNMADFERVPELKMVDPFSMSLGVAYDKT
jgi:hypothetical protein